MPARMRITYVTGSTSICDDARAQFAGADCSGTNSGLAHFHTINNASAGTVEIDTQLAGMSSLRWNIRGRTAAGTIQMRFERSTIGDFSDAQVVFNGVVTYGAGTDGIVCAPWGAGTTTPCPNGSQVQTGVDLVLTLLPNLVQGWATTRGMAWLAARLTALYFTTLDVQALCAAPPPVPLPIQPNDFSGNFQQMLVALQALAWPLLCECVPGTPTPTPYPPWTQAPPSSSPTPPSFPVSTPGDPAALSQILSMLAELKAAVAQDLALDTLEQRWLLPFATIASDTFPNLVGEGTIGVSRLLGVIVTVTVLPGGVTTWPGNPDYIKDLGWLSVSDGGAMLQELRITRQQQIWFPRQMQLATQVSWALTEGTQIALQGVRVEP